MHKIPKLLCVMALPWLAGCVPAEYDSDFDPLPATELQTPEFLPLSTLLPEAPEEHGDAQNTPASTAVDDPQQARLAALQTRAEALRAR